MSFDIAQHFKDHLWLDQIQEKLHKKMTYAIGKAREVPYIPYSTENGQWKKTSINWWTNGFWPASMWQMYLATGDSLFREEALRTEAMLDEALDHFDWLDHDVGFQWLIHSGVRYSLEQNHDSYARTMRAAQHLACRFNPNGFIRAWNSKSRVGTMIVDTMMNLPLLYWASLETGDPRFRLMAVRHADTAMKYLVRPDGSCNHIVVFDPETGEYLDNPAGQGYASGSSWSRGHAWALYGFALSYIHTGKGAYLETAKRVAHYFISQCADDDLARCDFCQPKEPELKDNAASAIAAAGLLVLTGLVPDEEAETFFASAVRMLRALEAHCLNWGLDDPALLTKCTAAYGDIGGRHMTMTYADYFFIEAINMLRGEKRLFWHPQAFKQEN